MFQQQIVDDGVLTEQMGGDGNTVVPRMVRPGITSRPELVAAALVVFALIVSGSLRRMLGDLIPGYRG